MNPSPPGSYRGAILTEFLIVGSGPALYGQIAFHNSNCATTEDDFVNTRIVLEDHLDVNVAAPSHFYALRYDIVHCLSGPAFEE